MFKMASQHSSETIHSGHFMASNVHELKVEDDEEIDVVSDSGMEPPDPEVRPDTKDDKPVTFYKFGPVSTRSIAIDVSLSKLNKCIHFAYEKGKLTTPKWKNFKGLKVDWKDRIRLNNVIWRAWHMQFVLNNKPKFCFFSIPDEEYWHNRSEANIIEGLYWKRRLDTVCAQYTRWRHFYFKHGDKRKKFSIKKISDSTSNSGFLVNTFFDDELLFSSTGNLTPPLTFDNDDDFTNWFTDTLFSSLNQPYMFPNPKQFPQSDNADLVQPGLIQLQPSIEEIMASLESNTGSYLTDNCSSENVPSANIQSNSSVTMATNQQQPSNLVCSSPAFPAYNYTRPMPYFSATTDDIDYSMTSQHRFVGSPGGSAYCIPYDCGSDSAYVNRGEDDGSRYGNTYGSKTVSYCSNSVYDSTGYASKIDGYAQSNCLRQNQAGSTNESVHGMYGYRAPYEMTEIVSAGNKKSTNSRRQVTYVTKGQATQSSVIAPPNVVAPSSNSRASVTSTPATPYVNVNVAFSGHSSNLTPRTRTAPLTAELLQMPTPSAKAMRRRSDVGRKISTSSRQRHDDVNEMPSNFQRRCVDDAGRKPIQQRRHDDVNEAILPRRFADADTKKLTSRRRRHDDDINGGSSSVQQRRGGEKSILLRRYDDVMETSMNVRQRFVDEDNGNALAAPNANLGRPSFGPLGQSAFLPPLNVEIGAANAGVMPKRIRYDYGGGCASSASVGCFGLATTSVAVRTSSAVSSLHPPPLVSPSGGSISMRGSPSYRSMPLPTSDVSGSASHVGLSPLSARSLPLNSLVGGPPPGGQPNPIVSPPTFGSLNRRAAAPFLSTSVAAAAQMATYYGLPAASVITVASSDYEGLRPITSCCSPYAKTYSPLRSSVTTNDASTFVLAPGGLGPSQSPTSPHVVTIGAPTSPAFTPSPSSSPVSAVVRPIPLSLSRLSSSSSSLQGVLVGCAESAFLPPSPLAVAIGGCLTAGHETVGFPSGVLTSLGQLASTVTTTTTATPSPFLVSSLGPLHSALFPSPTSPMMPLQQFTGLQFPLMSCLPLPYSPSSCLAVYPTSKEEQLNSIASSSSLAVTPPTSTAIESPDAPQRRSSAPAAPPVGFDVTVVPQPTTVESSAPGFDDISSPSNSAALSKAPDFAVAVKLEDVGAAPLPTAASSGRGRKMQALTSTGWTRSAKMRNAKRAAADSTGDDSERKRVLHLYAEQSRRSALKNGFEQLEELLPDLLSNTTKITNATVLLKAGDKIRQLQQETNGSTESIGSLKAQIKQFSDKISSYQRKLPVQPTSVKCEILQRFSSYIKEHSSRDPKFWLLYKTMEPLFETFKNEVKGTNVNELLASAELWSTKHCNHAELRPIVSQLLVSVATDSPILSEPSSFTKYLLTEAKKF